MNHTVSNIPSSRFVRPFVIISIIRSTWLFTEKTSKAGYFLPQATPLLFWEVKKLISCYFIFVVVFIRDILNSKTLFNYLLFSSNDSKVFTSIIVKNSLKIFVEKSSLFEIFTELFRYIFITFNAPNKVNEIIVLRENLNERR